MELCLFEFVVLNLSEDRYPGCLEYFESHFATTMSADFARDHLKTFDPYVARVVSDPNSGDSIAPLSRTSVIRPKTTESSQNAVCGEIPY